MSPYVLTATALVLAGMVAWLWQRGETRGEPARLFIAWLSISAITALMAAAAYWVEDAKASLSLTAAARMYSMVIVFLLFLFARSFSSPADFTVFFLSVPLQFGMAVVIFNWQQMFSQRGGVWVLDVGNPFAVAAVAVNLLYASLALVYVTVLYLTLRREGRERERSQTLIMLVAIVVLLAANLLRGSIGGASGYAVAIGDLGNLAGALLLLWAFRGPWQLRPQRGSEVKGR